MKNDEMREDEEKSLEQRKILHLPGSECVCSEVSLTLIFIPFGNDGIFKICLYIFAVFDFFSFITQTIFKYFSVTLFRLHC